MSKWRPTELNCLYVIGDIHGRYEQFELILKRILPLRKSDGGKDRLILLGDYVDRGVDSHAVLDKLIVLKKKYKDQLILLKGNHEEMMVNAINSSSIGHRLYSSSSEEYLFWMQYGGEQTLAGYLANAGIEMAMGSYSFSRFKVKDIVPKSHMNLMENDLLYSYETENYIFAHGGYNPYKPADEQSHHDILWGNKLYNEAKKAAYRGEIPDWEKTVVLGHFWHGPFVSEKLLMVDCNGSDELLLTELNSMQALVAKPSKKRLVAINLEPTKPDPRYIRF